LLVLKFMEAEKEKAACELEHELRAKEYANVQQKVNFFQKEMPRSINRAKLVLSRLMYLCQGC